MVYIYDANGSPIGFKYKTPSYAENTWDVYYYEKNLQGDIVAVYNSSGTKLISYAYSAWGETTTTYHNGGASTTAINNPYTYRGYYYDKDLGLYYLQSRYYDANICRFINPDKFVSTGQGLTGCNMFAYCGNNPVNRVDPTGELSWLIVAALLLFTPLGGAALQVTTSIVSYAGMATAAVFDETVRNDMEAINWNPFNTNESTTLNSSKVSFYKGIPVFRTNLERSGSFGAIFLRRNYKDTNDVSHKLTDPDELKHESGHNAQLTMMGLANYGLGIGIPSLFAFGPWSAQGGDNYYRAPWEITADKLGGVSRSVHTQEDID